jgi:hypothetical protein
MNLRVVEEEQFPEYHSSGLGAIILIEKWRGFERNGEDFEANLIEQAADSGLS